MVRNGLRPATVGSANFFFFFFLGGGGVVPVEQIAVQRARTAVSGWVERLR